MLIQKQYKKIDFKGNNVNNLQQHFFIIEEVKETVFDFLKGIVKVL